MLTKQFLILIDQQIPGDGILHVKNGALMYMGSNAKVTEIAPA